MAAFSPADAPEMLKLLEELRLWHYGAGPCDRPLCVRIDAMLKKHGAP